MEASAARAAVSVNHAIRTGDNLIRCRTAPQPAAFLLALSDGVSVGCHAGVRVTTLVDCRTEAPATPFQAIATELDEAALHDLARFLTSVFGGELGLWRNQYAHWWTLNPAWNVAIPRGWLVRSDAGAIVAFTANIPFKYVIDGKPALCCATGCTAVHDNFRGAGLAKAVGRRFLSQIHGDLLVATDSTPVAAGLWRSLGMTPLEARWQQTNFRVLADGCALVRGLSAPADSTSLVERCAGTSLGFVLDALATLSGRSRALSIELVDRFSELDAASINECKASNAPTYAWRDAGTLNWLYFGTQFVKRTRAVLVARSGARLVGYLAMKQWAGHSYYLLECRCRDADPEIARELIFAAREFARQNQARSIVVRQYTRMIEAALPATLSVPLKKPPMTYYYSSRTGKLDVENWEAGPGDGDVSVN